MAVDLLSIEDEAEEDGGAVDLLLSIEDEAEEDGGAVEIPAASEEFQDGPVAGQAVLSEQSFIPATVVAAVAIAVLTFIIIRLMSERKRLKCEQQRLEVTNADLQNVKKAQNEQLLAARAQPSSGDVAPPNRALSAKVAILESDAQSKDAALAKCYELEEKLREELAAERSFSKEMSRTAEQMHKEEMKKLSRLVADTQADLHAANALQDSTSKKLAAARGEGRKYWAIIEGDAKVKEELTSKLAAQTKALETLQETLGAKEEMFQRAQEDASIVSGANGTLVQQMKAEHALAIAALEDKRAKENSMRAARHTAETSALREAAKRRAAQVEKAHRTVVDEYSAEVARLCAAAIATTNSSSAPGEKHPLYEGVVLELNRVRAELRTSRTTQERLKEESKQSLAEVSQALAGADEAKAALSDELKETKLALAVARRSFTGDEEKARLRLEVEAAKRTTAVEARAAAEAREAQAAVERELHLQINATHTAQAKVNDAKNKLFEAEQRSDKAAAEAAAVLADQRTAELAARRTGQTPGATSRPFNSSSPPPASSWKQHVLRSWPSAATAATPAPAAAATGG